MADVIEFDPVDALDAGALGVPGQRTFMIQARKGDATLSVLVEKEQVALLASEATSFLDRLARDYPESEGEPDRPTSSSGVRDDVPLFRARMIGLGFDVERGLVLIELREAGGDGPDDDDAADDPDDEEMEGHIARFYATRAQVRAMALRGATAVASGRPPCPLCEQPMDPDGHRCPRLN
jgi:uncharacterized repeat protein (TIGR03847 family)